MRDNTINKIQANIIIELLRRDELRFAEINVGDVQSDQFSYHLRYLIKKGLIEKTKDNKYRLTTIGRTRANMLYPNRNSFIEQGFLAVRIVLTKETDGQPHYLMQRREYVPYKGSIGTPGDKILFGEDVYAAAKRIMKLETGLDCDMSLRGLAHIRDTYEMKTVQDKYFFVMRATNPKGDLFPRSLKGEYLWMTYSPRKTKPA